MQKLKRKFFYLNTTFFQQTFIDHIFNRQEFFSFLVKMNLNVNGNIILVKESQRGNPVLDCIKNVNWQFQSGIIPDYILTSSCCALFISIRYHLLHPNYLFRRIKEIGRDYRLRVVLCQVDIDDNIKALLELNKLCFSNRFTLILSWSPLEAGRYLETFKSYENKPSTSIQEKVDVEFLPQVTNVLKCVKSVNRTDVVTLFEAFGNLQGICTADESQLLLCPGQFLHFSMTFFVLNDSFIFHRFG